MKRKTMKSKGVRPGKMKAGALKKGGAGAVPKMGGASPVPPRGNSAPLGAAGAKLGPNRKREKRLQNAQL